MVALDGLGLDRVDLIKIDVEGMEAEVLRGARGVLERLKPQLLVERIKTVEADILGQIEPLGYRVFPSGLNLLAIHADDPVAGQVRVTR
jgi:hypothetical protein